MTRAFLLLICLYMGASIACGQNSPLRSPEMPRPARLSSQKETGLPRSLQKMLDRFFENINGNDVKKAFIELLDHSDLRENTEVLDSFANGARLSFDKFGPLLRVEFIESRALASRLLVVSYLAHHNAKFFRWQFVFFNPIGAEWRLVNLKVDDMREFLASVPDVSFPPDDVSKRVDKFFMNLQAERIRDAFEILLAGSAIGTDIQWTEMFIKETDKALATYGKLQSYELYDNHPLGASCRLLTYFGYLENEPLRWQFIFRVETPEIWTLTYVRVDDMLDETILVK